MHTAEECLEDYARQDRAAGMDFLQIDEHVAGCAVCQERLNEIYEYVAFLEAAPCESQGSLMRRHHLESGTVFLAIAGNDATGWEGHAVGPGVDVAREFLRGARAKAFLEDWFTVAHPGHRCGISCTAGWNSVFLTA